MVNPMPDDFGYLEETMGITWDLGGRDNPPKIAPREVRYAAVMKYDQRIRETGSSDNPNAQSPGLLASTMRDEFAAYIRGWSDGAGAVSRRVEFTYHSTLAAPYNEGYVDGRKARNMAHVAASEKYGHKVSVVRTPGKIGDDDQPTSPKRLRDIVTVLSDSNGCQTHSWEDASFPSRVTKAALDAPSNGLKVCNGCLIRAGRIVRETMGLGV